MNARKHAPAEQPITLLPVRTAARIREDILRRPDGDYLGSEEDLLAQYGVSQPTLRQTARLLEQEQLLTVRRGQGGGYYVRRPVVTVVARAAASYLRTQHFTADQVLYSARFAAQAMARGAALCLDEEKRSSLTRLRDWIAKVDAATCTPNDLMDIEESVRLSIGSMAAEPIAELILAALRHVADEDMRKPALDDETHVKAKFLQLFLLFVDTVLASEPELAESAYTRLLDFASETSWASENSGEAAFEPRPANE